MTWEHSESVDIAASPADLYAAVSQLERMGEWSPENKGGTWIKGDGSSVGDQFQGDNEIGDYKWQATAEVTRCDPGEAFCFSVGETADWGYHFEAIDAGCRVTETWAMNKLPPTLADAPEERIQGRVEMVQAAMATTLANLKASVES